MKICKRDTPYGDYSEFNNEEEELNTIDKLLEILRSTGTFDGLNIIQVIDEINYEPVTKACAVIELSLNLGESKIDELYEE